MQRHPHVHLLSAIRPPSGGLAVWTNTFIDHAPHFGIAPLFESIGPTKVDDANRILPRLGRFGRGFLTPLYNAMWGRARKADIVHVCVSGGLSFSRGVVLAGLLRAAKRPSVVHLHSRVALCSPAALWCAKRLARGKSVRFVTPNQQDAEALDYFTHVHNFVPPHVRPNVWTGVSDGPGLRLVYAGAMIPEKGLPQLLQALSMVPGGVTLDCYGPDQMPRFVRAWQAEARRLGLSARVHYRGCLAPRDVGETLRHYDALVLPSRSESFSLIAAECMRLGLPVLASPVGFLLDAPNDAWVKLGFAPEDMANAIAGITTIKAVRLPAVSQAAMQYIDTAFCAAKSMNAWRAIYAQLRRD